MRAGVVEGPRPGPRHPPRRGRARHDPAAARRVRPGHPRRLRPGHRPAAPRLEQPRLPPRPPPPPGPASSRLSRSGRPPNPGQTSPTTPAAWPSGCWCLVPVGPAMTADPLTAVLDQLAAHREQLTQLDDREAAHFAAVGEQLTQLAAMITTMGRTLADDTAALARLEALDRQVTELAARLAGPGADGKDRSPARPGAGLVDAHPRRTQASRSPSCGPGSSRCTGPATATWPPPSAPAGRPTTCACTGWTSPASCGGRCTSSPPAAPACCPPRPNTRPASCPLSPPS